MLDDNWADAAASKIRRRKFKRAKTFVMGAASLLQNMDEKKLATSADAGEIDDIADDLEIALKILRDLEDELWQEGD